MWRSQKCGAPQPFFKWQPRYGWKIVWMWDPTQCRQLVILLVSLFWQAHVFLFRFWNRISFGGFSSLEMERSLCELWNLGNPSLLQTQPSWPLEFVITGHAARFLDDFEGQFDESVRYPLVNQLKLLGGDWLPWIWHFPRNIGNFIIPIDELIFFQRGSNHQPVKCGNESRSFLFMRFFCRICFCVCPLNV